MDDVKRYNLYLLHNTIEAVKLAEKHRFYLVNKHYVLIYTDVLHNDNITLHYHIIDQNEASRLSDKEKVWLLEANTELILEESAKKQDEILQSFGERLDRFERELEKASQEMVKQSV